MRSIEVGKNEADKRLDKLLGQILSLAPKSFIYKMLRKKNIKLNGKKAKGDEKLKEKDLVEIYLSEETFLKFAAPQFKNSKIHEKEDEGLKKLAQKIDLKKRIIYEDRDVIFFNKPENLLSQKAEAKDLSANELLCYYLRKKGELTQKDLLTFHPSIVNRLDRNTTGLLVYGKSLKGLQEYGEKFKNRQIDKYYLCLAEGVVEKESTISGFLKKDQSQNQVKMKVEVTPEEKKNYDYVETKVISLATNGAESLCMAKLITGKTHQIRASFAGIGHPLLGDHKYCNEESLRKSQQVFHLSCQLLHCYQVVDQKRTITAPPPEKFYQACKKANLLKEEIEWEHGQVED